MGSWRRRKRRRRREKGGRRRGGSLGLSTFFSPAPGARRAPRLRRGVTRSSRIFRMEGRWRRTNPLPRYRGFVSVRLCLHSVCADGRRVMQLPVVAGLERNLSGGPHRNRSELHTSGRGRVPEPVQLSPGRGSSVCAGVSNDRRAGTASSSVCPGDRGRSEPNRTEPKGVSGLENPSASPSARFESRVPSPDVVIS